MIEANFSQPLRKGQDLNEYGCGKNNDVARVAPHPETPFNSHTQQSWGCSSFSSFCRSSFSEKRILKDQYGLINFLRYSVHFLTLLPARLLQWSWRRCRCSGIFFSDSSRDCCCFCCCKHAASTKEGKKLIMFLSHNLLLAYFQLR